MANNTVKKEYIKMREAGKYLKVELYYSLGGINYFTYKNEPRGYYLSACPVERREYAPGLMMEGFTAFTGTKMLVEPCERKSKGAEARALAKYDECKAQLMPEFAAMIEVA